MQNILSFISFLLIVYSSYSYIFRFSIRTVVVSSVKSDYYTSLFLRRSFRRPSTDDSEAFGHFNPSDDDSLVHDDRSIALEEDSNSMEKEIFKELSHNSDFLMVEDFMRWEDVQEMLKDGVIDEEIVKIVLAEVGLTTNVMVFEEFKSAVELLNQVALALEQNAAFEDDSSGVTEDIEAGESYDWITDAFTNAKP